jgi:diadenosine tetraphosphatase ApaH/serine/threonine PP2A family protein phosphatase
MTDQAGPRRRYQGERYDSARWLGFPFRDGDIVISTPSRTGTTWAQMICALLIFGEPQLPAPLGRLSPWLDHLVAPREEVYAGREILSDAEIARYHARVTGMAPPDMLAWLHSPRPGAPGASPRA